MPVAGQRDPADVPALLEPWLRSRLPEAGAVRVEDVTVPQSSGFSNETFLFAARWDGPGGVGSLDLVLRSQSEGHVVFPEADLLEQQCRTMQLLGEQTAVPVPRIRWVEPDPSLLGQPFYVMDRVEGRAPGDNPPFTAEGFVVDMSAEERRRWSRNGLRAMCAVGDVDWRSVGFDHLDLSRHGALGPEQRQGYLRHFLDWATGGEHPVARPAWDWLTRNWPDDSDHIDLCWGDARPGNILFRGTDVTAVLDWEMVSLGNRESDLGWWLFVQRYMTEGNGLPLLDGMMNRAETIAEWEELVGRPAASVDFYELVAGFQFTLVLVRLAELLEIPGLEVDNPVARLTADLLDRIS